MAIVDLKGRRWITHFRYNARYGWQWEANWEYLGVNCGNEYFDTKDAALANVTQMLTNHDAVEMASNFFRRLNKSEH